MTNHLELLGLKVKDVVSGAEGVIDSVCYDLYGCVQVSLRPAVTKDGELKPGHWMDISRIKILSKTPVMKVPGLGYFTQDAPKMPGPAEKAPRP